MGLAMLMEAVKLTEMNDSAQAANT